MSVVADVSRPWLSLLFPDAIAADSRPLPRGLRMVVTTAIQASAGMRFRAKLHPTQPALRTADDKGGRMMTAGGAQAPRLWFATLRREHWGKTIRRGARRIAAGATALPSLS